MKVFHGRSEGVLSEQRGATFTGAVWADPIMPTTDNVTLNNVFFSPGARTHWHTHEQGQMLHVLAGKGWICQEGRPPRPSAPATWCGLVRTSVTGMARPRAAT